MQIATGSSHVLALDTAGNVYSWGSNNKGQLGILDLNNGGKNEQLSPEKKELQRNKFTQQPMLIEEEIKQYEICQIYAGNTQSFAVTRTGKIFAWGDNKYNLLGLNFEEEDHENVSGI